MKTAIISPTPLLEKYGRTSSRYHLALSQLILDDPGYGSFYRKVSSEGDFVILDNMAHEGGVGKHVTHLLAAWEVCKASELVLPDRLFFGDDTLDKSRQALLDLGGDLPKDTSYMGVPQGRTLQEWGECAKGLIALPVNTIGISKDYEVWPGGLLELVDLIYLLFETSGREDDLSIHLLGWGRDLRQLKTIAESDFEIRGVDSAKPLVYAANDISLVDTLYQGSPKYPGRPHNFFSMESINGDLAAKNINLFQSFAGHTPVQRVPVS